MQRLITIIVAAIAVIAGFKQTIKDLRAENETLRNNDQTDKDAIAAAQARNTDLENQIREAEAKADELSAAITAEPMVPNVDADFNVTGNSEVVGLSDAELSAKQREAEGRGQVAARPVPFDPNLPSATRENISRQAEGAGTQGSEGNAARTSPDAPPPAAPPV